MTRQPQLVQQTVADTLPYSHTIIHHVTHISPAIDADAASQASSPPPSQPPPPPPPPSTAARSLPAPSSSHSHPKGPELAPLPAATSPAAQQSQRLLRTQHAMRFDLVRTPPPTYTSRTMATHSAYFGNTYVRFQLWVLGQGRVCTHSGPAWHHQRLCTYVANSTCRHARTL